jgi:hypothetical protein
MPIKKMGLNISMNREQKLYWLKDGDEIQLTSEFMAMQPKFSPDFTKLCYIASDDKFLSHSGNY